MNIYVGYFNLSGKLHCFRECKSLMEANLFIDNRRNNSKLIIARILSNEERGLYVKR